MILFSPYSGMSTKVSRGKEVRLVCPLTALCSSMTESARAPSVSSWMTPPRASEPTMSQVSPGVSAAPDRASTRWSWEETSFHSQATRAAMRARTTTMTTTVQPTIRRHLGRVRFGRCGRWGVSEGPPSAGSRGDCRPAEPTG